MNEIIVESWNELTDMLYHSYQDEGKARSPFIFRGHSDKTYKLETTLRRLLGSEYKGLERNLIRNFRKYARRDVVEQDSFWHWLALGQHHGLPTRLIDWTFSPFTAAHFATGNLYKMDVDGVVLMLNYREVNKLLPDPLKNKLQEENANLFTAEFLSETVKSFQELDAMNTSSSPFMVIFEPPSIDDRIVNQFALFTFLSDPAALLDDWIEKQKDNTNLYRKIIIPAKLKWEIRERLDRANVTERVLFPGLDGLCKWLERYYTPRRKDVSRSVP